MKQVVCFSINEDPSKSVRVEEAPDPACAEDGVVVAVKARPINPADILLLTGRHAYKPELPAPVGIEGAGVVEQAGPRSSLRVGDLVAIPWGGTWRERMALRDADVLALPAGVNLEQAAMLSVNPFTAIGMLEGVPAGSCVALNAATSAISKLLLSLCRHRGISTVAVVRDNSAEPALRALGASAVLVDGPDLADRIREAAPGPIVRALDAVAGDASGRMYDAVADGGTLMVYGLLSGDTVSLPAAGVVFRDVTVRGFSRLRSLRALGPARRDELTRELLALVTQGLLETAVDARFSLDRAAEAIAHQQSSARAGKVLLLS
jgi:trans-2-enoyl-CoA reductase